MKKSLLIIIPYKILSSEEGIPTYSRASPEHIETLVELLRSREALDTKTLQRYADNEI